MNSSRLNFLCDHWIPGWTGGEYGYSRDNEQMKHLVTSNTQPGKAAINHCGAEAIKRYLQAKGVK